MNTIEDDIKKVVRLRFDNSVHFFATGPEYDAAISAGYLGIVDPVEEHLMNRYYITDKGYELIGEKPAKLDPISSALIASMFVLFIVVPWIGSVLYPSDSRGCNTTQSPLHPLSEDFERSRINNMLTVPRPC